MRKIHNRKIHSKRKGEKIISIGIVTAMSLFGITACGNAESPKTIKETVEVENESTFIQENGEHENRYFGEITAIDDNLITVEAVMLDEPVGEKPEVNFPPEEAPDDNASKGKTPGDNSPEERSTKQLPGEKPSIKEGTPNPRDFENLSKETMTIEVTDNTIITNELEEADLAALQVGDNILFTLQDNAAISIHIGKVNEK